MHIVVSWYCKAGCAEKQRRLRVIDSEEDDLAREASEVAALNDRVRAYLLSRGFDTFEIGVVDGPSGIVFTVELPQHLASVEIEVGGPTREDAMLELMRTLTNLQPTPTEQ